MLGEVPSEFREAPQRLHMLCPWGGGGGLSHKVHYAGEVRWERAEKDQGGRWNAFYRVPCSPWEVSKFRGVIGRIMASQ